MPPATTIRASPNPIAWLAMIMVMMLDPHTLLTVVAPTEWGMPAPMEACRAGAWPRPADRTQPMYTSSTRLPGNPIRFNASAMAMLPSFVAGTPLKMPLKLPIGVRAALTMTASFLTFTGTSPTRSVLGTPSPWS